MGLATPEELNERFLAGERIALEPIRRVANVAPHHEMALEWERGEHRPAAAPGPSPARTVVFADELLKRPELAVVYADSLEPGLDSELVIYAPDADPAEAGARVSALLAEHSPSPGPFERGVVACTGSEFCRFAIVETKARAAQWARWLDRNLAPDGNGGRHGDEIIRMHLSGCSASCAQPQIADIGLRGEVAHSGDAVVEAVDVGLGGSLGGEAAFIDWVEGAKPAVRHQQSSRIASGRRWFGGAPA